MVLTEVVIGSNSKRVLHPQHRIEGQRLIDAFLGQHYRSACGRFHILNRCLNTAIADAVTRHARITAELRLHEELERLGQVTHEVRGLNTALIAFDILKRGLVAVNGSTGAVLGRSLVGLRDLVENTLADIRTAASHHRPEPVSMLAFLTQLALAARLQAEYDGLEFAIEPIDAAFRRTSTDSSWSLR